MTRSWLILCLMTTCLVGHVVGVVSNCPHERTTLELWSDDTTWPTLQKPSENDSIDISSAILMDINPPALYNITILAGGSLVFDPRVELDIRVANIYVYGSLEIGSEDCLYDGKLTITLTGNRESHDGEENPKVILVEEGGSVEMHGLQKRSWTKLTRTHKPDVENADIFFDYSLSQPNASHRTGVCGVLAYTFKVENGAPVMKKFDVYDLNNANNRNGLLAHLQDVDTGEVLMMASQKYVRVPEDLTLLKPVYEALETLLYDDVTNTLKLRNINPDGDTWALVFEKGVSNSSTEVLNPLGVNALARHTKRSLIFSAEVYGADDKGQQTKNFRIGTIDGIFPKIELIDDVTSWIPGDKLVIASTDYDFKQAEEYIVALCTDDDCAPNEVRLDGKTKYEHFGEILSGGAIDMRGEVMVLNRNILIQGTFEDTCPAFNKKCGDAIVARRDLYGGHIKVMRNYHSAKFENIELRHMGQQTDLGRYPLHFHLCFAVNESASKPYIKGCSIHHTFARCATVHGSHNVTLKDNACYLPIGHGYFLEDGGELDNVYDGNLVINVMKGPGFFEPMDRSKPAGFWMTNPNTGFINNHAAGGEGHGIWFVYPEQELYPSRYWDVMGAGEAKRTMIPLFYNNVAHSMALTGVMIGNRLQDDRVTTSGNKWQPLQDPKDPQSSPIQIPLERITCYKNRDRNLWIEGGLLDVTRVSVSDSANGMIVSNEGQQDSGYAGQVSYSVVIGESDNKGKPATGFDRSLPFERKSEKVQSGVSMWKGPIKFHHMWFDGFQSNPDYDIAAIAKKRASPYFFSVLTSFSDALFAFVDGPGKGTIAISGTKDQPGWEKNRDGELISGFTWDTDEGRKWVVKPDPFTADPADCVLRTSWRMAICTTKYGNLRASASFADRDAIFVRDDVPSASLQFDEQMSTGPQVVLNGARTYTVHFTPDMTGWVKLQVPGLDQGDKLRVGVCTPLGSTINLKTTHPYNLNSISKFTAVTSLADLDIDDQLDGQKYYHDNATGMVYFKFINTETRHANETKVCNNGRCPDFRVEATGGDPADVDCRSRLYTATELNMPLPVLPEFTDDIPANGNPTPPVGYGAGITMPFLERTAVNGGWGDWSEYTTCSRTCGVGQTYRTRQCNEPMPENGGASCTGNSVDVQGCIFVHCPIKGEFGEWGAWGDCVPHHYSQLGDCSGKEERVRACDSPSPLYGGEYCTGMDREVKPCTCFHLN